MIPHITWGAGWRSLGWSLRDELGAAVSALGRRVVRIGDRIAGREEG